MSINTSSQAADVAGVFVAAQSTMPGINVFSAAKMTFDLFVSDSLTSVLK